MSKIAFIAPRPFSDNRGQKLLGRLRASALFTPNSIFLTIGEVLGKYHALVTLLPHIQCWSFSCKKSHHFFPLENPTLKWERGVSVK